MEVAISNVLPWFQRIGYDLFIRGLVSSHSGNMSIRTGKHLVITRRGSMLAHLSEQDLVETGIYHDDEATSFASTELPVHRAIYKQTTALAVVHAHPPHAIALSMVEKQIIPTDMEGCLLVQKIPVLGWNMRLEPGELGEDIALALGQNRIIILYGHGTFAVGQLLEEAYHWTSALEESCHILYLVRALESS
jgi:L-fuculose-phosphate aldolase